MPLSPLIASVLNDDSRQRLAWFTSISKGDFVAYADGAALSEKKRSIIKEAVLPWKLKENELKKQWEDDEDGFSKLPARAWPPHQPDADEQAELETQYIACEEKKGKGECEEIAFNLATCLVFNNLDPGRGLNLYKQMAANGHVDSTVAAGIVLLEGLGVDFDEKTGLKYLTNKKSLASAQGAYEYASAIYTGLCDVSEPEKEAFKLFRQCAAKMHTGGLFLTAEMIFMEEKGVEGDLKDAVPLFAAAAERGHRMSRQRMREFFKY